MATEAAIERISHKVECFVISGAPSKDEDGVEHYKIERAATNTPPEVTQQYADKFNPITSLARSAVRDLCPSVSIFLLPPLNMFLTQQICCFTGRPPNFPHQVQAQRSDFVPQVQGKRGVQIPRSLRTKAHCWSKRIVMRRSRRTGLKGVYCYFI